MSSFVSDVNFVEYEGDDPSKADYPEYKYMDGRIEARSRRDSA